MNEKFTTTQHALIEALISLLFLATVFAVLFLATL
jgi:hypothetical protein